MTQRFDLAALLPELAPMLPPNPAAAIPWVAQINDPSPCGAVLIADQQGNAVAWATDAGGHIYGDSQPDPREPARIARHAQLMAAAPEMAAVITLIVRNGPHLLTLLRARGITITAGLAAAVRSAELIARDLDL